MTKGQLILDRPPREQGLTIRQLAKSIIWPDQLGNIIAPSRPRLTDQIPDICWHVFLSEPALADSVRQDRIRWSDARSND